MKTVQDIEQELRHYLCGVVDGWQQEKYVTEEELWRNVQKFFTQVPLTEDQQWLQDKTVDLMEEARTYARLNTQTMTNRYF
jgi:hypothetical protein